VRDLPPPDLTLVTSRFAFAMPAITGRKLLSVNVGLPRQLEWKGKVVRTAIFKAPVTGRVRIAKLNVEGDQQSDLTVHGRSRVTIADVLNLYRGDATNQDMLRRVSELPSLPNSWRDYLRKRLWNPDD
jgi:MOSC domain-containing protein YiiM